MEEDGGTEGAAISEDTAWERHAGWWQRTFTGGVDAEYTEQILPMAAEHLDGAERVLDVGCGEGQVARAAAEAGALLVVGCDPAVAQIEEAVRRAGGPRYLRAGGERLPFGDGSFDAAVACLVLEHLDDALAASDEITRVLRVGGRFLFFLNHPLLQTPNSGWIDDHLLDPPEQYWRIGRYLVEDRTIEEVQPGVLIPFVHRPLGVYVNAMAAAGLLLEAMDEPAPPPGFLVRAPEYPEASSIPRLLFLRAHKHR